MARFNLVKIRFSKNTLIEWTCIQVVKNVSYCLVIVLKVIKIMFHIGTKNIVSATSKFCNFHQIEPTHDQDAVCVSLTEPHYVDIHAIRYFVKPAN